MHEERTTETDGTFSETDLRHMSEALALAERGRGFVSPNPVVGAILVRDGNVVGRGWHARYGEAHAEAAALAEAGEAAFGATLYVTLEPCCVWGNTPPCADAIVRAGVREVVAAMEDPNPAVAGQGIVALRAAGLTVRTGVLAREAARANRGYVRYRTAGLPSVTLKLALSLDGRVAAPHGGPRWTSSPSARDAVHAMRAAADCVLTGVGTTLADDPLLTDRRERVRLRQPARLVFDSLLRTPVEGALAATARDVETIVACSRLASADREAALSERGVQVWRFEPSGGGIDPDEVLRKLALGGKLDVLAECGPTLATSLLRDGLCDRAAFFVSPVLYGASGGEGLGELPPGFWTRETFVSPTWTVVGGDVLFEAELAALDGPSGG